MSEKIRLAVYKIFYIIFFLSILWLLMNVLLDNISTSQTALMNVLFCVGAFLIILLGYQGSRVLSSSFSKNKAVCLCVIFFILFCVQLFFGIRLATKPVWDFDAIYGGAISLIENKNLGSYKDYFGMFFNNMGGLLFLKNVFSVFHFFGIDHYYMIGTVLNVILLNITFLLIYLICERLWGVQKALFALFLCICLLPSYFWASIFYTDTLSMVFIPLTYYIYLLSKEKEGKKLVFIYFLMGIVLAIGALIKFTVAIIGIAILTEMLLDKCNKEKIISGLVAIVTFFIIVLFTNILFINQYLDEDIIDSKRMPLQHWIMMGLEGNGSYNPYDYDFSMSIPTLKERKYATSQKIFERIKDMGFIEYFKLLNRKSVISFGDGTYSLSDFLDDNPQNETALHEIVLPDGKYFDLYRSITSGYLSCLILLAALSSYYSLCKKHTYFEIMIPRLSFFGIFLFLLMWETSAHYIINYIPIFIICAVMAMGEVSTSVSNFYKTNNS